MSVRLFYFQMIQHYIFSSNNIKNLYVIANYELESLSEWFRSNKLSLNVSKTNFVIFNHNKVDVPVNLAI